VIEQPRAHRVELVSDAGDARRSIGDLGRSSLFFKFTAHLSEEQRAQVQAARLE
jgi:hypothetical protein